MLQSSTAARRSKRKIVVVMPAIVLPAFIAAQDAASPHKCRSRLGLRNNE